MGLNMEVWVADVSFEGIEAGQVFLSEATPRLESLAALGYVRRTSGELFQGLDLEAVLTEAAAVSRQLLIEGEAFIAVDESVPVASAKRTRK